MAGMDSADAVRPFIGAYEAQRQKATRERTVFKGLRVSH